MLALYWNRSTVHFFALGMGSGIPFFLVLSTLSFWLTESHISTSVVGLFSLVTVPYTLKFLLAPLLDRFTEKFHGNGERGLKIWGVISQIGVVAATGLLGCLNPSQHVFYMAGTALMLSLFASSLDIVVDTLRINNFTANQNGAGAAIESIGFRVGMFIAGAGALYLASLYTWGQAYWIMAFIQLILIPALWWLPVREGLQRATSTPGSIALYVKESFAQLKNSTPFFYLILLILVFKIPDTVLNAMSAPFLFEIGFDKLEYANITKSFGIPLMIIGSLVAGYLIHQLGCLIVIAAAIFLQGVSCLLFVIQFMVGHDSGILMLTVGIESFTSGMASAAFIAMISSYCKPPFCAGHYTILYAVGSLSRVLVSSISGVIADCLSWNWLFFITAVTTIPAFAFLITMRKTAQHKDISDEQVILPVTRRNRSS